jgi:predicted TPR repeat methyltransferase
LDSCLCYFLSIFGQGCWCFANFLVTPFELLVVMDSYQITFRSWDKVATAYEAYFMDLDLYNDTYDAFCELLHQPYPRVLEIGCGPGNISRYLLRQRPDLQLEGVDISPSMIALAQAHNPTGRFLVLDCRHLDTLSGPYDAIVGGFCLPYLSQADCHKLFRDCAALLAPGGIFYISTIEGLYENSGYETGSSGQDQMYVYYYPENYLQARLDEGGFKTLHLFRKTFKKRNEELSTHLIWLVQKC